MRDREEVRVFLGLGAAREGWSPHTRTAYRRDLDLYCAWLEEQGEKLSDTSADRIVTFLRARQAVGDGARTLARRLAALRSFHRFLLREGVIKEDVLTRLPSPKRPQRLPKALERKAVQRLLDSLEAETPLGLRDRAIIEMLYGTGARVSELTALTLGDLVRNDGVLDSCKVMGKGGKERYVPLHALAAEQVDAWLERGRPRLLKPESGAALFLTVRGRPMSRIDVGRRLGLLGRRAGIAHLTPHMLRHSFATHLVHGGADLRAVQELLGHANLETTTIYTAVDSDRFRGVHDRHHPRS